MDSSPSINLVMLLKECIRVDVQTDRVALFQGEKWEYTKSFQGCQKA